MVFEVKLVRRSAVNTVTVGSRPTNHPLRSNKRRVTCVPERHKRAISLNLLNWRVGLMAATGFEPLPTGYRDSSILLFSSIHALGVTVAQRTPNPLALVRIQQSMPCNKKSQKTGERTT